MRNVLGVAVVLVAILVLIVSGCQPGTVEEPVDNRYESMQLMPSMAGSGDPWSALTKQRLRMVRGLHDDLSLDELAAVFQLSTDHVRAELEPMMAASLVRKTEAGFVPTFLIVDAEETRRVRAHAKETGEVFADLLEAQWTVLEAAYRELDASTKWSFEEQALMLVGSRILDIGLLGAMVENRTLLEPAPARPGPETPDARYYFWMVEGEHDDLGCYGQQETTLPAPGWHLLTFGRNIVDGEYNPTRAAIEGACAAAIEEGEADDPEALAQELGVAYLNPDDSSDWAGVVEQTSRMLAGALDNREGDVRQLFSGLASSNHAPESFAEFVCWYVHLVYAEAIDSLLERGVMGAPAGDAGAVVLFFEGSEGLLT